MHGGLSTNLSGNRIKIDKENKDRTGKEHIDEIIKIYVWPSVVRISFEI